MIVFFFHEIERLENSTASHKKTIQFNHIDGVV